MLCLSYGFRQRNDSTRTVVPSRHKCRSRLRDGITVEPQHVVDLSLSQLQLVDYNPRTITREQMDALKRSLTADPSFFRQRPCLVNLRPDGRRVVYAGAMRLEAARQLGWETVPCLVDRIPLEQEWERNLKDNNAYGEYVEDRLAARLYELDQAGRDLTSLGFPRDELDALLTEGLLGVPRAVAPDEAPAVPPVAVSQRGELYELGTHRLLCGDATNPADVDRLMAGEQAALLATDPPYVVDYTGADRPGGGKDWSALYRELPASEGADFFRALLQQAMRVTREDAAVYVWMAHRWYAVMITLFRELGILPHQTIVWAKPAALITFSYYAWRHELALFGWRQGFKPPFNSRIHKISTVWAVGYDRPGDPTSPDFYTDLWQLDWEGRQRNSAALHPTQKPVGLFEIPMRVHTRPGDLCYEPFAGSGSQLIAAERLRRRCFAMELQPVFCDVIRDRYARFVGKPELAAHPEAVHA